MLRAIIFDFNGIILNDEPLHFASMRDAVGEIGITVSREEYWQKYLPFDDAACLEAICRDRGVKLTRQSRELALGRKIALYQDLIKNEFPLFPGVASFIRAVAEQYPLALASGARREEIETTLQNTGLHDYFRVVVGAEDFTRGKPNPESYLLALDLLNSRLDGASPPILPGECLVIEDSIGGVKGARAAGMKCLAVSNTYPRESLQEANLIVASLEETNPVELKSLMEEVV
jgi:beta-phosphoglucomutase